MVHLKDYVSDTWNCAQSLFEPHHGFDFLQAIAGGIDALANGEGTHRAADVHHRIRHAVFDPGQIDATANEDDANLGVDTVVSDRHRAFPLPGLSTVRWVT